jgi:pyruvate formate lyase activating enzyme
MKEALLYEKLVDRQVRCCLCAHRCLIAEDAFGVCQVRENREGTLYTHVYGSVIARHVDPIEKKPLFHFFPGSIAYSVATPGCNFRCLWCQNWEISQMPRRHGLPLIEHLTPNDIVDDALASACQSIAYTYTEPTIFFEYARDVAQLADGRGIHNIMVTNGFMTQDMLEAAHPYLDAVNVDLKAFRDDTYRKYIGGRLQPVLDNLKLMRQLGIWLEVTSLIIPGLNDDPDELRDVARFIADELGPQTPWHLSRFHRAHRMTDVSVTPLETLVRARDIGREAGLRYVYLGNVPQASHTCCHECGEVLVQRSPTTIVRNRVTSSGRCSQCHAPVAGVGMGGANASVD